MVSDLFYVSVRRNKLTFVSFDVARQATKAILFGVLITIFKLFLIDIFGM